MFTSVVHDWAKQYAVYNHQFGTYAEHVYNVIIYSDDLKMHAE